jgi:hypothetical protein
MDMWPKHPRDIHQLFRRPLDNDLGHDVPEQVRGDIKPHMLA